MKRKRPLKASKPLGRKKPLQGRPSSSKAAERQSAGKPVAKPRAQIKPLGQRGKRLDPERARAKRAVRMRSGGRCEMQERGAACGLPADDWHHLFGRGNIVPEPLASSPQLTRDVCREHHDRWHAGELELIEENRWLALHAMAEEADYPRSRLLARQEEGWKSKDALLAMLRELAEEQAA